MIGVHGACTEKGGPICIVMEYALYGSLRDYLRQKRGVMQPKEGNSEYIEVSVHKSLTGHRGLRCGNNYLSTLCTIN